MITNDNNNSGGLLFSSELHTILAESAESIVNRQVDAALLYHRHSGTLQDSLQKKSYSITDAGDFQSLIFSYPKHIRSLDRQHTVWGRKKKDYHPIYNKPLYGEIYRYTIPMVRGVIRRMFRRHISNLKKAFNKPIDIQL